MRKYDRFVRVAFSLLLLFVLELGAKAQEASPTLTVQFSNHDVRSVFFINKSENRNQVHYAVRATADCKPSSVQPVFGYWRDFEDGPRAISPLLAREERAYGLEPAQKIAVTRGGALIVIRLRAMPLRPIRIRLLKNRSGRCQATATMRIAGDDARLDHVFVQLRTFLGIPVGAEYLRIHGTKLPGNQPVVERVSQ